MNQIKSHCFNVKNNDHTVNFEKIRLEVDLGVTFSADSEYTIFFPIGFMTSEI